ncbi:hypothetical protein RUM43_013045 [Polyplax serrata]|uniref:Uncharacterized protein n=1 Tax=Polyplax serrata TaxID=468196 RepID=A0AAN8P1N4_POLSC
MEKIGSMPYTVIQKCMQLKNARPVFREHKNSRRGLWKEGIRAETPKKDSDLCPEVVEVSVLRSRQKTVA